MSAYQRAAFRIWLVQLALAAEFHNTRLHRRQGVWGALRTVCIVTPGSHAPILTSYNQSRQNAHRG
jgi:hypothetical protein